MHLVSLEVSGLKSLRSTTVEGLDNYNVFIGKNDSGKSTILQAIRLLGTFERGLQPAEVEEIMTDKTVRGALRMSVGFRLSDGELMGIPEMDSFRGEASLDRLRTWRYDFEMRVGDPNWTPARLHVTGCGPIQGEDYGTVWELESLESPRLGQHALSEQDLKAVLESPDTAIADILGASRSKRLRGYPFLPDEDRWPGGFHFALLRGFLEETTRYLSPKREARDEMPVQETLALESSGDNITQVLDTLQANYTSQFDVIVALLRQLFPSVAGVHLTRERDSAVVRIRCDPECDPIHAFRLSEVGTGIQQVLMLATAVVSAPGGAVVLIEEPENNLHAGAQRALADFLLQHAIENDKQILLTTHSTIFASQEEGCNTYVVRLDDDEGTVVHKLEPGGEPAVKEELGIRNVDLYGYNGVVLWEGDSEAQAMPLLLEIIAEQRGTSIHRLGLTSRNLHGHTNMKLQSVREFLSLLKGLDVRPYVVMDDDEGVMEELERLVEDDLLPLGHYHIWQKGREEHGRNPEVSCEFEDNFSNDQLVRAAMTLAEDAGVTVELDAGEFAKRLGASSKKTSDELRHYYKQKTEYGLSKPELSRKLAQQVAPELRGEADRTVEQYEFETVASDIFDKLGGMT